MSKNILLWWIISQTPLYCSYTVFNPSPSLSPQTPSPPTRAAWRLLRGRAPLTVKTPSADTGTDEGPSNPHPPTPPSEPQQDLTDWELSRMWRPLSLIAANHKFIFFAFLELKLPLFFCLVISIDLLFFVVFASKPHFVAFDLIGFVVWTVPSVCVWHFV